MKTNHQNLIKLLEKNKEDIDRVYMYPNSIQSSSVSNELISKGILLELGSVVSLNPFYRQFVNTILLKADYSILFGNYDEHTKEILLLKKRFIEENRYSYIERIKKLISDLYTSIVLQDFQVEALLYDMSNQISIELDQLIDEAKLILEKVKKFLDSINRVINSLDNDLLSIHKEIENSIENVKHALEPYLAKIQNHCNRFSELIRMSEEKKAINQKLFSLAAMIIQRSDDPLIEYLVENQNSLAFSIDEKIQFLPYSDNDLNKVIKGVDKLLNLPIVIESKTIKRKKQKIKNIPYVNQDVIINDLKKVGCEDLYLFLLNHIEFKKLHELRREEEVFRMFLLFSFNKEYPVSIEDDFNSEKIRRVSWS